MKSGALENAIDLVENKIIELKAELSQLFKGNSGYDYVANQIRYNNKLLDILKKECVGNSDADAESKHIDLMIEAGKSYNLRHPNGVGKYDKLHIDYILDNPTNSHWSHKLIVCRYWGKHKQRWFYYTYLYFSMAIYNDWYYGEDES